MTPRSHVFKRETTRHNTKLACDIVDRCVKTVAQQMHSNTAAMDDAELRGYVRARALPVIRADVEQLLATHNLTVEQAQPTMAIALERTVQLVVRELQFPPVISFSLPPVPMRAAA